MKIRHCWSRAIATLLELVSSKMSHFFLLASIRRTQKYYFKIFLVRNSLIQFDANKMNPLTIYINRNSSLTIQLRPKTPVDLAGELCAIAVCVLCSDWWLVPLTRMQWPRPARLIKISKLVRR